MLQRNYRQMNKIYYANINTLRKETKLFCIVNRHLSISTLKYFLLI